MKPLLYSALLALAALTSPLHAETQTERLKRTYETEGDSLFVPFYWIPEAREIMLKQIPDHDEWVGFELGRWKKVDAGKKEAALQEIGAQMEALSAEKQQERWQRIAVWNQVSSQVTLLIGFLGSVEAFHDMAFEDPLLRPAFNELLTRRPDGFDQKMIGSSLSSGEIADLHPVLVGFLMDSGEKDRLECFSRLFSRIAEKKESKGE